MKKVLCVLLVFLMLFSLVACKGNEKATNITTGEQSTETVSVENETVSVEKQNDDVTVTISNSFKDKGGGTLADDYIEDERIKKIVENEDGSFTLTMSKKSHEEMLSEMKEAIEEVIAQFITEGSPYKSITLNDEYKTVTIKIDKAAYESAFELSTFLIGMSMVMYQEFSGIDTPHCEVIFQDEASGEKVSSTIYPEAFNKMDVEELFSSIFPDAFNEMYAEDLSSIQW